MQLSPLDATVLAALKHWQKSQSLIDPAEMALATNDGATAALTAPEIDAYCAQLLADDNDPDGLADELAEAVRGLKAFGGDGGTDVDDRINELLDQLDDA